jgi:hypothetical protein
MTVFSKHIFDLQGVRCWRCPSPARFVRKSLAPCVAKVHQWLVSHTKCHLRAVPNNTPTNLLRTAKIAIDTSKRLLPLAWSDEVSTYTGLCTTWLPNVTDSFSVTLTKDIHVMFAQWLCAPNSKYTTNLSNYDMY